MLLAPGKGGYADHHYKSQIASSSKEPKQEKIVRISSEVASYRENVPCEETNAIFLRTDEERCDVQKFIITGAKGTPYAAQTSPRPRPRPPRRHHQHARVRIGVARATAHPVALLLGATPAHHARLSLSQP